MTFVATDPHTHEGKTNTWLTPLSLIRELGEFDLDPCGFPNHHTAKRLICLPEDGLAAEWHGRVWLNPPYGKHAQVWLAKLADHGDGIALVFGRLDTKWLQPFIGGGFFAIKGRVRFIDEMTLKPATSAGAPSILIPFGRKNIGAILSSNIEGKWFQ